MAEESFPYPSLRVFTDGSQVAVQPAGSAAEAPTLSIDLKTSSINVSSQRPMTGSGTDVLGLLGVCKLYSGVCLIAITSAKRVATIKGADIYEMMSAKLIHDKDATKSKENRALLKLLGDAVDANGFGRGIYFSHFYDLTLTSQRIEAVVSDPVAAARPLALRADTRFFYNRALSKMLLDAQAYRFVTPVMLGFVRQVSNLNFSTPGKTTTASITLVARRAVDRAGTRQWRRGADPEGNVANFVETEQIFRLDNEDTQASYVEVRGSIPLLWTQLPNIKYKPTTVIAAKGESVPAFDHHFEQLVEQYRDVVAINLINHKGTEGKLEVAFRQEAQRFCADRGGLRYLAFDFHHETSGSRYGRLSLLWDKIQEDFTKDGYALVQKGQLVRRQEGVMRINCIDCLDRTNVVQGVLARKALEMILIQLGLLAAASSLPQAFPAVEKEFKILWADHGDAVSEQYAGTGAMKSGFTRTGKRTLGGVVDDAVKAVVRYYLNNFQDGKKQDAMDLFTGAYTVTEGQAPPLRPQPSPLIPLFISLAAVTYGAYQAGQVLQGGLLAASTPLVVPDVDMPTVTDVAVGTVNAMRHVLTYVFLPILLGAGLFILVVQQGKHLVIKPQLCPQLAVTVRKSILDKVDKTK